MKIKNIRFVGRRKTYDIEVKDNHNFYLANGVLSHNSGKTFALRGMLDRTYKTGYNCIFLCDVKDEMKSSCNPVQTKFRHLLNLNEKPSGIPVITLRPSFFKSLEPPYNKLPEDNEWFSVSLKDMTYGDFKMLLNYSNLTAPQQINIDEIWNEMKKLPRLESLDQINSIIDNLQGMKDVQIHALKQKFKPIFFSNFFDAEYCRDIINPIKNGVVFALNMENFESFGRDSSSIPQIFMTIVMRKVIQARRQKLIQGITIFIDEMSRFIPENQDTVTTIELKESVDLDARYYINYVLATQEIEKVPPVIMKQCRFIFVPYSASIDSFKYAVNSAGLARNVQMLNNTSIRLKAQLHKHDWLMIDRNIKETKIFKFFAPLSEHSEVTKD